MKDLQRERGLTYLFISHDLSVVRYLSDRIGVMYLGKLVEIGPAEWCTPARSTTTPGACWTRSRWPIRRWRRPRRERGIVGELPSAINPPSGCRFRTRCPAAQDICAPRWSRRWCTTAPSGHQAACHFPLTDRIPA